MLREGFADGPRSSLDSYSWIEAAVLAGDAPAGEILALAEYSAAGTNTTQTSVPPSMSRQRQNINERKQSKNYDRRMTRSLGIRKEISSLCNEGPSSESDAS
jgi:hypothetical protein